MCLKYIITLLVLIISLFAEVHIASAQDGIGIQTIGVTIW